MASITKRGDKWAYSVSMGMNPITRKQNQITRSGFHNKKEAKKAAQTLEYKLNVEGGKLTTVRNKFSEVVEDWLILYAQEVKPGTLRIRKKALDKVLPIWGNKKITTIEHINYQSLITNLSAAGYSRNYVESIHHSLSLVFKHAKKGNLIFDIPCRDVKFKKEYDSEEDKLENFLERDELSEFLSLAKSSERYDDYIIFLTLALTGLRIGELMALRWEDINLDKKFLRVRHTLYNPNNNENEFRLISPKTKKSKRVIQLADKLQKELISYKKYVESNFKIQSGENFLFFRGDYKPLTNTHARNRLVTLTKKWDYKKKITLHSFRHTFTSLLIEDNFSILDVSNLLGHVDTSITIKVYTHITQPKKIELQNSLSKFADKL
ncbi:tyrosine-type recombinase/integrase [Planococcus donghaensis]|uniref:tyrosine-type recombinase/integrase n=1 Tax=Planococcus donghaensis TaxID=414778 RepID=UPI003734E92C